MGRGSYEEEAVSQSLAKQLEHALCEIDVLTARLNSRKRRLKALSKEVKEREHQILSIYGWAPFRAGTHITRWASSVVSRWSVAGVRRALRLTETFITGRFGRALSSTSTGAAAYPEGQLQHGVKRRKERRIPPAPASQKKKQRSSVRDDQLLTPKNNSDAFATVYQISRATANALRDATEYVELAERRVQAECCDVKLIAYYLPQFHPIPENDIWWGRGFTEWRNVAKAVPAFVGHYQPKLPGELGFYDLRVPDVMRRQAELARLYGISAFCFHFYWFGGKQLLEGPLLSFLNDKDIDIKFCLCWANENWTRKWDGAEDEVLVGQSHSPDDDIALIRYLKMYFDDPRYLKIDGKPILTVYRPGILPNARATTARWRTEATAMGLPGLWLVATNSFGFSEAEGSGFDVLSEFPPHGGSDHPRKVKFLTQEYSGVVHEYAAELRQTSEAGTRVWPGVMPAWDNTARRPGRGIVYHGSSPGLFQKWLDKAVIRARRNPPNERFVLINAWNEWAEGAYLEPDQRYGYAYLAACGSVIRDNSPTREQVSTLLARRRENFRAQHPLACVLHLYYEDMAIEFASRFTEFGDVDLYITVPKDISYETAQHIVELFPDSFILEVENRGRDMLPFLTLFEILRKGNHHFICKLHTKRSAHLADGKAWCEELVTSLLSPAARAAIREADNGSGIGILATRGSLASLENEKVRRNSVSHIRSLAANSGLEVAFNEPFVAGSMFWFRPEAMLLFSRLATAQDFEPELGQIDGTLAHALERMTIIAARASGYDVMEIEGETITARQY